MTLFNKSSKDYLDLGFCTSSVLPEYVWGRSLLSKLRFLRKFDYIKKFNVITLGHNKKKSDSYRSIQKFFTEEYSP